MFSKKFCPFTDPEQDSKPDPRLTPGRMQIRNRIRHFCFGSVTALVLKIYGTGFKRPRYPDQKQKFATLYRTAYPYLFWFSEMSMEILQFALATCVKMSVYNTPFRTLATYPTRLKNEKLIPGSLCCGFGMIFIEPGSSLPISTDSDPRKNPTFE